VGKDAAIAALRPVFGTVPPSALREELLAHVADAVDLAPSLVSSWLPVAGERAAGGGAPRGRPPASRGYDNAPMPTPTASRRASDLALAERAFLAQCLVTPSAAADVLPKLDKDAFSSPFMARLAAHVEANLENPQAAIPDDDAQLSRAVAGLLADARWLANSPTVLRRELALIELKRLERAHKDAVTTGSGNASGLRVQVDGAKQRWEELMAQSLEEEPVAG
jgi:DNA primase